MNQMVYNDLISVVIPVFNAGEFLQPLMDSIVQQTYSNWEVIFVDDGSQDNSVNVIENQILKDNRFSLIVRPDTEMKGAPTCRNIGMRKAKGEYLIFFDADDIIADFCFEQRLRCIKESGKDFCVFPMIGFENTPFDMTTPTITGTPTSIDIRYGMLARFFPFLVVTNIYKKEALIERSIEWDTNLKSLQDSDFNVSCMFYGLTFYITGTPPDYYARLIGNNNSITKQIKKKVHSESHLYLFEKEYKMCKGMGYESAFYGFTCYLLDLFLRGDNYEAIHHLLTNNFMMDNISIRIRMNLYYYFVRGIARRNAKVARVFRMLLFPRYEYTYWITGRKVTEDRYIYLKNNGLIRS